MRMVDFKVLRCWWVWFFFLSIGGGIWGNVFWLVWGVWVWLVLLFDLSDRLEEEFDGFWVVFIFVVEFVVEFVIDVMLERDFDGLVFSIVVVFFRGNGL